MNYGSHYSVLKNEVVSSLTEPFENGPALFADLTLGGAGHTKEILAKSEKFHVVGFDQDLEAINNASSVGERLTRVHTNFENAHTYFENEGKELLEKFGGLSGVLMDLGISSHHLDSAERGFSFRGDGPLDMRMDQENNEISTAADLLADLSEKELERIFREYGEESLSKKIASIIVSKRKVEPILRTKQLEEILFLAYPPHWRHGRTHPATRVFQALRIAVNNELGILSDTIDQLALLLKPKARMAIITFHSLEDRIVKHKLRELEREKGLVTVLTKKPILPTEEEISENSRSRSAKLRIIEKLDTNQGVGGGRAMGKAKKKYFKADI